MAEQKHYVNGLIRLKAQFKNSAGTLADPGTVYFKLKRSDGTTLEYQYGVNTELKKESTGIYYVDYAITMPYKHTYGFRGTSPVQQAAESSFIVEISEI